MTQDIHERIEVDRRIASRSTYWGCCCGFDHVPGCKTHRTEIITKTVGLVLIGLLLWYRVG